MPLSGYFGGHGNEVMAEMKAKHGDKEGESIFYATANAKGQKPGEKKIGVKKDARKIGVTKS